MTYIETDNSGYVCIDDGRHILFSDDGSHSFLFDYINKDISDIGHTFEQHVSTHMNIKTFELTGKKTNKFLEKIKDKLESTHPYYKHEYPKVIIHEIGTYFNRLLAYSIYGQTDSVLNPNFSKEWYIERLCTLMPSPSNAQNQHTSNNDNYSNWTDGDYPEGLYPSDFYNSFIKWTKISEEAAQFFDYIFINNIPSNPPIGFFDELETQKNICNMLYFSLDITIHNLESLTPYQRLYLYSEIYEESLTLKKRFLLHSPLIFNSDYDNTQAIKKFDAFAPINRLKDLNIAHINNIPAYMLDNFNKAVEYTSLITDTRIYEEYEIENLHQLLYLEILSMIKANQKVRKCKNCDKYFIITDKNTDDYCTRILTNGMTCKEKSKLNPIEINYRKAYKTHHARMKKGKITKEDLDKWRLLAKEKLELVRAGELELEAYQKWLKG